MIIFVKVKTNSKKSEVIKVKENNYLVNLISNPENNGANLELIKVLSRHFRVPNKNIIIKAGLTKKR